MTRPEAREPQADTAWLADALREQAVRHDPDSDRIEARFALLTAEEPHSARLGLLTADDQRSARRPRRIGRLARLRLAGVPLGIVAAVASAGAAAAVSLGIGQSLTTRPSHPITPPSTSTAAPRDGESMAAHPAPVPTSTAAPTQTHSRPTPTTPSGPLTVAGTVNAHSTQFWAQEDVAVTTTHAIRELHVVVTVSGGSKVQNTGAWTTIVPADATTTTVTQVPGGLVYDIVLKPGQTLQAGTYIFGVQFNRPAAGHDFGADSYRVTAVAADNSAAQLSASGSISQ